MYVQAARFCCDQPMPWGWAARGPGGEIPKPTGPKRLQSNTLGLGPWRVGAWARTPGPGPTLGPGPGPNPWARALALGRKGPIKECLGDAS